LRGSQKLGTKAQATAKSASSTPIMNSVMKDSLESFPATVPVRAGLGSTATAVVPTVSSLP